MTDLTWSCEVSSETLRLMRRELEWALQHQRAKLVDRMPQNRLALRTRQRAAFVLASVLLVFSLWLWTQPGQPTGFVIACAVIAVVALVAVPFVPRYFAWAAQAVGKRLARQAVAALEQLERVVPTTAHYHLHDGKLAVRLGDHEHPPLILRNARAVVVTPHAAFPFANTIAPAPLAMVLLPSPDHALVDTFADGGATVTRANGPIERYGEWTALPPAIVR